MNITQQGVLVLLKSAVTGTAGQLPGEFSLEEALPIIRSHQLVTLAYAGAVHCGVPPMAPVMQQLLSRYGKLMLHGERQMKTVERICAAFEAQGIDYMPVKGCCMKPRYPSPELRIMGDADILIRMEQYERIRPLMLELGFEEVLTSDHELIWKRPELYLELHKRLIPSYNEDYYAYFGDGWLLGTHRRGHCYSMAQEDEYIYLFTHFAKHYRDGGIGCRHVMDLWVMRRWMQEPDDCYIRRELEKLGLERFHENMMRLLDHWFEDGAADDVTELISQFIFSSGSWGGLENHVLAMEARNLNRTKPGQLRRNAIFRTIFPGAGQLKYRYPILQRRPYLLPAVWVWRWIDTLLFSREKIGRQKRRLDMIREGSVTAYQRSLDLVGLGEETKLSGEARFPG